MNRLVKSFIEDPDFKLLESGNNYYIFMNMNTDRIIHITVETEDKIKLEFKDKN